MTDRFPTPDSLAYTYQMPQNSPPVIVANYTPLAVTQRISAANAVSAAQRVHEERLALSMRLESVWRKEGEFQPTRLGEANIQFRVVLRPAAHLLRMLLLLNVLTLLCWVALLIILARPDGWGWLNNG